MTRALFLAIAAVLILASGTVGRSPASDPPPQYHWTQVVIPPTMPTEVPASTPVATTFPTPSLPGPSIHSVVGVATWYAYKDGQAAAARALRLFLGPSWRGMTVTVTGPRGSERIRLTDYESSAIPGRLIDLDSRSFATICGPLSMGVCRVSVSR